ncbi:MAG: LamB/YcsF family protein [Bacteroidota bacterium]
MKSIDLNCDMGELIGAANQDEALMPYISSCNICCGKHAGDDATIFKTVEAAVRHGLAIGAHPGYDDRENFGRVSHQLSQPAFRELIEQQLDFLQEKVVKAGGQLHHIKAHGALYHDLEQHEMYLETFLEILSSYGTDLRVYGMAGTRHLNAYQSAGITFIPEAFADRRYASPTLLVSRKQKKALLASFPEMERQVLGLISNQQITTLAKGIQRLVAKTLCIHSDTPNALKMLILLHQSLQRHGIQIHSPQ